MGEHIGLNHISARILDVDRSIAELRELRRWRHFRGRAHMGALLFFEPDAVTALRFGVGQPDARQRLWMRLTLRCGMRWKIA